MIAPRVMCDGDPASPICIVGGAPQEDDLRASAPFTGSDGALIWSLAQRAGFTRADAYMLYTIGEYPDGDSARPTQEQLYKYWEAFDEAITKFKGGTVLALGPDAFWRVCGHNTVLNWRGYLMPPETWQPLHKVSFIVTTYKSNTKYHRKGEQKLQKAKSVEVPPLPPNVNYVVPSLAPVTIRGTGFKAVPALAYDIDRAWRSTRNALNILDFSYSPVPTNLTMDHEAITVDIETSWSKATGTGFITRVGMANEKGAWSAPWNSSTKEHVQRELSGIHDRVVVGHNLCFDIPELEKAGVKVGGRMFDTMLAAQLLQPDLFKGLNSAASLYLDVKRWKHLSDTQPELYNAHDVIATYYLYKVLREGLKERGALEHFEQRIMPALRVLMDMNVDGMRMDIKGHREWQLKIDSEINDIRTKFAAEYPGLSISSPSALAKYIWGPLRERYPQMRLKPRPGVDESTLIFLRERHPDIPMFDMILKFRELNEYKKRFDRLIPDALGRVYPSYSPDVKDDEFTNYGGDRVQYAKGIAGTGRIQAKEPNPQQLPKKARRIFIPHTPGNVFMEFDYDSAELRVCAGLSGDTDFLAAVNGPDMHASHAKRWGCSRDVAKTIVYATLYGSAPRGISVVLHKAGVRVDEPECDHIQRQFFASYPRFTDWRRELVARVRATRCLLNPFGRPRYFWHVEKDIPAALDFLPQSTVADIVWTVLGDASHCARVHGGRLRTIVHDSFLFELPANNVSEAYKEIKKTLERPFDCIAPGFYLPTKAKIGPNWGELTLYVPPASPTPSS